MRILVIGGTGFIGRQLVTRLVSDGHFVHVPTRGYQRGRDLLLLPTVTLFESDVHDDATLESLVDECDAVINLVGILHSSPGQPYGPEFARAHVELPARVARICRAHGVRRLLHISALGADAAGPSAYLRSKAAGEAAIIEGFSGYERGSYTIFRPSIVFGPHDHFTNLFAKLARWLPVLAVPGANARMQPIYVGDVAAAMAGALANSQTWGRTYPLAGLKVYTLGELAHLSSFYSGRPRRVLNLPMSIARMQAMIFERLPGTPLISRDNLASLTVDNVSEAPMAPELGIVPTSLEAVAPMYLKQPR